MKLVRRLASLMLCLLLLAACSGCGKQAAKSAVSAFVGAAESMAVVSAETALQRALNPPPPEHPQVICHAMGEIDGDVYTNSLEAFQASYAAGYRYFEVDFSYTVDHRIVCLHDWTVWFAEQGLVYEENPYGAMSYNDFAARKIMGRYTPLDLDALARLMADHPDIYLITDTKRPGQNSFKDDISRIRAALEQQQPGLSNRMIVQLYVADNFATMAQIDADMPVIFTTYMAGLTEDDVIALCENHPGLWALTVPEYAVTGRITAAAAEQGIPVYTHTVNGESQLRQQLALGVAGVYTDSITPEAFRAIAEGAAPEEPADQRSG